MKPAESPYTAAACTPTTNWCLCCFMPVRWKECMVERKRKIHFDNAIFSDIGMIVIPVTSQVSVALVV